MHAWNERGGSESWPKDLANKSNCDGTGHGATGAAPSRIVWPYQHSAAFRRQCAKQLQQDSAELASTVLAPVFYCHLSTSPRPRAVRCGADAPDDEPERRGPPARLAVVLWVGPLPRFGGRAPLDASPVPPYHWHHSGRYLLVRSGVWSMPASLTGPRLSVPRPSVQSIGRRHEGRLIAAWLQ